MLDLNAFFNKYNTAAKFKFFYAYLNLNSDLSFADSFSTSEKKIFDRLQKIFREVNSSLLLVKSYDYECYRTLKYSKSKISKFVFNSRKEYILYISYVYVIFDEFEKVSSSDKAKNILLNEYRNCLAGKEFKYSQLRLGLNNELINREDTLFSRHMSLSRFGYNEYFNREVLKYNIENLLNQEDYTFFNSRISALINQQ